MAKPKNLKFMFLFFIGMLVACSWQPVTTTSTQETKHATKSSAAIYTPTIKSTIQPHPLLTYTITPTPIPLMTHSSSPETTIEVIVFTWDWPMKADIPPIHIWKDNRAMWIDWKESKELQYEWHVYETILADDEMNKVKEIIEASHFWDYEELGTIPDVSSYTIWVRQSGQEKRVVVMDSKLEIAVSSLIKILEASPLKTEYFPNQGYLFARKGEPYLADTGFPWPDEKLAYDFSKSEEGILVDGEILSTVWESVLKGYYLITSHGTPYHYRLKIPGLTCLYNYNETNRLWECNIYSNKSP